eukprot:Skav224592  [mRNA]  locus=scaffold2684:160019:160564:+ [translate_table: standard]
MEPVSPEIVRIVRHLQETGQLEQITGGAEGSASHVPITPTGGSMHDGCKRRLMDDEEYKTAGFEVVEPPSKVSSGKVEQDVTQFIQEEFKDEECIWSFARRCQFLGVKHRKLTYAAMIALAKTDEEIQEYLRWASTAGVKSAKLDDLRSYMVAVGFSPKRDGAKPPAVTYPGTAIPREFEI